MDAIITGLLFVPLLLILWLANLADRHRPEGRSHRFLAAMTYLLLFLPYGIFVLIGLGLYRQGTSTAPLPPAVAAAFQPLGIDAADAKTALAGIGLGIWLPSLLGIVLALRPIRHLLSHILPIDPARTVHAVALSFSTLIVANLLVTLGAGLKNVASLVEVGAEAASNNIALSVWTQDILLAALALLGVGWLSRRSLGQALQRLGLVVPSLGQVAVGLGVGLVMVPVVLIAERLAAGAGVAPDVDVSRLTEALTGPLFRSIPGILTLGLAAALGEEAIFRGALQPRFGLLLTAVLFALVHSNYGLTLSTVVVLTLGLALGLLRQRTNTTTTMVTHAAYNMTLGIVAYLHLF